MKILSCASIATLFLLLPFCAKAQIGLYAEYSAAKVNQPGADWIYGPTFGGYFDHGHLLFLSTGLDVRGTALGSDVNTFKGGLLGPRFAIVPHVLPLKPYVEALIGAAQVGFYRGSTPTTVTKMAYQFLGGLDLTILPRIDWRVVEFSYGGLSSLGTAFNPKTVSTGIVVRLP